MVLVRYVTYLIATGEILSQRTSLAEVRDGMVTAEIGVVDCDPDVLDTTHYVLAGVITLRPTIAPSLDAATIQADGGYNANITGIPTGWAYELPNGDTGTTNGTTVSFRAIEPGTYPILFTKWPYLPYEVTINAVSTVL